MSGMRLGERECLLWVGVCLLSLVINVNFNVACYEWG